MHLQNLTVRFKNHVASLPEEKLAAMKDLSSKHSIRCAVLPLMFFKVDL